MVEKSQIESKIGSMNENGNEIRFKRAKTDIKK